MTEAVKIKNPRKRIEDRISKLPDDVISRILSLMPTKFAVRTSILSNRWKYLWTNITNLDFVREPSSNSLDLESFIDFVDRVFQLCKSSQIQLFRLRCPGPPDCFVTIPRNFRIVFLFFNEWITKAIRLNPSQIVIEVLTYIGTTIRDYSIPLSLFTCETLTTLRIDSFGSTIASYVYLPNLKTLGVSRIAENLLQMFIYGCPMLEDLSFYGWIENEKKYVLNITAPTMKRLTFRRFNFVRNSKIVINTPNLEYLDATCQLKIDVENLESLVCAILHLDYHVPRHVSEGYWKIRSDLFLELLRGVSGVKSLLLHFNATRMNLTLKSQNKTLFMERREYLTWMFTKPYLKLKEFLHGAKLAIFHHLTSLEMMVFSEYSCRKFLPQFLESSPNLKYLSLEWRASWWYKDLGVQVQCVSGCSLLPLEEIKLKGFKGKKKDLAIAEYLLSNAKVLKRLNVIGIGLTRTQERLYCNKLLKLKKAAGNCKIEFHGDHVQIPSLQGNEADASLTQIRRQCWTCGLM